MSVIHKDIIESGSVIQAERLLYTDEQYGDIVCWYITGDKTHIIEIIPTGYQEVPENFNYLSTVQMLNGLVWHVFYKS